MIQSERHLHAIENELEEAKAQLDLADQHRRVTEQELSDIIEQLSDATYNNQALQSSKRKLDSEMQTMHVSNINAGHLGILHIILLLG